MSYKEIVRQNVNQGIADYVNYLNNFRLGELLTNLNNILSTKNEQIINVDTQKDSALYYIEIAKKNIENLIDSDRGSKTGLHGFIAEQAEAGISNARRVLKGLKASTTVLNDNGPVDLMVNGNPVQLKFYKNLLAGVRQSPEYDSIMMFPKDQVEVFKQVMNGAKTIEYKDGTLTNRQIHQLKKLLNKLARKKENLGNNGLSLLN